MLLELSIVPLGRDTHLSDEIAEVVKLVDASGLSYQLTPSGTCIEGEWDDVMALVRKCHARARDLSTHVITTLQIEDEAGARDKLARNVQSVEEKLGRSVATGAQAARLNGGAPRSPVPGSSAGAERASGKGLTLLIGLGLGAALMYFLDPDRGARRRALVRDQASSALRQGGRGAQGIAEDARNRAAGTAAEIGGRLRDEQVTDDQLVARVRAQLGHHVERARAIEVVADGGRVVLRGEVGADEVEDVLSTVRGVRGVDHVDNQLGIRGGSPTQQL
jgi:uncharacterized protein (TIGR00106 family)